MYDRGMEWWRRLHSWANKHEWLILLLLLVVVFRLPSLFMPHYYGDEEIYFVMGRAWREGVPLYLEMFDHKPPLIYVLAGLFPTMFSIRLMLLIMMGIHTWLFWELAKSIWAKVGRPGLAYVSSIIFVILTTSPWLEGLTVNAELLMMVPVTAAVLLLWKSQDETKPRVVTYGLAGLLLGIAWLYKIPVAADAAAIGIYFVIYRGGSINEIWRKIWTGATWVYVLGFVAPLLTTFGYYWLKGSGPAYLDTVLTMNLGYVSSWSTSAYSFNPFKSGLVVRGTILMIIMVTVFGWRKKLNDGLVFVTLWLAFGLFGALLSGRPYPHYLQQPIIPFALWLPWIVVNERIVSWIVWGGMAALMMLMQVQIKFWGYQTISIYRDFWQYTTGKINKSDYYLRFDNVKRNYAIAEYLKERLGDDEKIFIWGSDPTVYNLTDRLPTGGKYIVSFHVHDLNKHDYVINNLGNTKPKYIVWMPGANQFEQLEKLLARSYDPITEIEGAMIYRRSVE